MKFITKTCPNKEKHLNAILHIAAAAAKAVESFLREVGEGADDSSLNSLAHLNSKRAVFPPRGGMALLIEDSLKFS